MFVDRIVLCLSNSPSISTLVDTHHCGRGGRSKDASDREGRIGIGCFAERNHIPGQYVRRT
jgi:hypothetical protein